MKDKNLCLTALIAIGMIFTAARADDADANPLYTAWSKASIGSSASYAGDIESGDGKKIHFTGTVTLKELNADGAKVESVSKIGDHEQPAEMLTILAKAKADDVKAKDSATIHALDKNFKCDVFEINFALAGAADAGKPDGKTTATLYLSNDIPGGTVKMVVHPPKGKDFEVMVQAAALSDQHFSRDAQAGMQPPDHRQGQ